MVRSDKSLEEMYASLVIEDGEDEGIILADKEVVESKQMFLLVGRLLTEKNITMP